jgi:hypothetical protein
MNQIGTKNSKSTLNILYKENGNNNINEKDIASENEMTDTSKKNIAIESEREKDIKTMKKNSSDSANTKLSTIKRNKTENKLINHNNLEIKKQQQKNNYILESPIISKNTPIFSNEENNILFYPNNEFYQIIFDNTNNKISAGLNNNSKDLIKDTNLEQNFNKVINNGNKDEKIIRKNKFITDNNFWDNNTGNLIEENCYYSYQIATKDKFNTLNRNIGKNIINDIQTKKFNSRLLNSLEKNNSLNKSSNFINNISITSRNDTNNLQLISNKEYYSIKSTKNNYNLEVNKIKNNNLFEYINSSNNNYMNDVNQNWV